ncbi:glycosyltransferase family 4 protein [Thermodesulfovibrio hydrogeniphilus]
MNTKVCILTTVHSPFDTRIFHKEAKTLAQAGYDVTLIAQHEKDVVVDGVKIIALPKLRNRLARIFGLTWRAFCLALRQRADIYHFHDPELIPVGLLLRLLGKRVIYDVHENVPKQILHKEWIPSPLRWLVAKVAQFVEAVAGKILNAVVAATPQIAKHFPAAKTVVVQNFPILDELLPPNPMPYTSRPLKVAYVGGITAIRGVREMVQAMALLPNSLSAKLVLVGTFSPLTLEEVVRRLPGWERVEFLGWQDRSGVAKVLGDVRVGLVVFGPVPNNVEGWPAKLFEYMSTGLPVIASNFPLWKEIVEGNQCGITVDPLDPKAIAQAIEYLLTNPEEAQKMGENGRRAVKEKYNWDLEAAKLLSLYKELLLQ